MELAGGRIDAGLGNVEACMSQRASVEHLEPILGAPFGEAHVDFRPTSEALGEVAPRAACARAMGNRFDKFADQAWSETRLREWGWGFMAV